MGLYGTLVGLGGGFMLMPIFLLLFKLSNPVAAGTSLAIVCLNAGSGALGYLVRKKVNVKAGVVFALATFPGAYFGSAVNEKLSGALFSAIFGAVLLVLSVYFWFRGRRADVDEARAPRWVFSAGIPISIFVGFLSSILGIGGGIVHVPAMSEVQRFPFKEAVATSHFILFFTALVGALSYYHAGNFDLSLVIPIGLGVVVGGQTAAAVSKKISNKVLIRLLCAGFLVVGLKMIAKAF